MKLLFNLFSLLLISLISCSQSDSTSTSHGTNDGHVRTNDEKSITVQLKVPINILENEINILKTGQAEKNNGKEVCLMELKQEDIVYFGFQVSGDRLNIESTIPLFPKWSKRISGETGKLWGEWHCYDWIKNGINSEQVTIIFSEQNPHELIFKKVCTY